MKGQRATKGKSAADKKYDKIEDKLQDKLRSEIPTEKSSLPARPFASYDPGHRWPKLFAGYDSSGRKRATKGKSAADKIYDKIDYKLQDKIQDKIHDKI